ncbi:hypothetical protein DFH29DRAFT_924431 [Suillus ampliporus]|nr:hypothetical protein DFH29DRAFT_924431 [Suillus ampliporus]
MELTFLRESRWGKVKYLYVVARYVPFLLFIANLYLNDVPNENPEKCQFLNTICACFGLISVLCSECFFVLRTYALWNKNKIVLAVTLTAFIGVLAGSIGISFPNTTTAPFATSPIPGITGCYQSTGSNDLFIPFLLLLLFQLGLMSLTIIRAIQSWRSTRSHLYAVLVKHNVFYYGCGVCESGHTQVFRLVFCAHR